MKTLFRIINKAIDDNANPPQTNPCGDAPCNYTDNYYGDQACILKHKA
ncbi:hypothetical protein KOI40_00140 [Aestuariicella sp. G3-2]|nr:hypothetical protein [Aestuariicella albida]MBU3068223.1 hypothetical protein [Aestuariicella albida]